MGVEVVTVSCDTKFVHLAWQSVEKALGDVRYQMGSDPNGSLARTFGVYLEEAGVALRGTFLISPDGVVLNSEVNFLNLGRNIDEIMRKFKANLYLARKTEEGIPAQWNEEGDVTLKPSARMVGKVHESLEKDGIAPGD
jgi:alkyl hydroperoxide reductase subunit AhpC